MGVSALNLIISDPSGSDKFIQLVLPLLFLVRYHIRLLFIPFFLFTAGLLPIFKRLFSLFKTKRNQKIHILIPATLFHRPNKHTSIFIMHFSTTFTALLSLTSALAAPIQLTKRSSAAGVLKVQTYDEFNISGGVSGNALAEVAAAFPVRQHFPPCLSPSLTLPSDRHLRPSRRCRLRSRHHLVCSTDCRRRRSQRRRLRRCDNRRWRNRHHSRHCTPERQDQE